MQRNCVTIFFIFFYYMVDKVNVSFKSESIQLTWITFLEQFFIEFLFVEKKKFFVKNILDFSYFPVWWKKKKETI